jgi:beta-lactamase superfamily II metal-dependent hydrolase
VNAKRGFVLALVVIGLLALGHFTALATPQEGFEVSFIDVGQGDSALISDSSRYDVLIDGGKSSAGPTVVAYIHEQNIDTSTSWLPLTQKAIISGD